MTKKIRKAKPGKDGRTAIAPPLMNDIVECPKCPGLKMTMRELIANSRRCYIK